MYCQFGGDRLAIFELVMYAMKLSEKGNSMKERVVTHEGTFGLYLDPKDTEDRIFSGTGSSPIALTVRMTSPPVESIVEIIVDGHQITDGVIRQVGVESRTFWIEKAETIDLVLREKSTSATGTYTISVLI
jgi:hypothetical protein